MNFKQKHIAKLKRIVSTAAIVSGGAFTLATQSSCENTFREARNTSGDMFSRDTIHGKDIFGQDVVLQKVDLKLYADKNGTPSDLIQTTWGIENQKDWPKRTGENTHIEKAKFENSFGFDSSLLVEVYDSDMVLVDKNCFMVDDKGFLRIIGDAKSYLTNLERYHQELKAHTKSTKSKISAPEPKKKPVVIARDTTQTSVDLKETHDSTMVDSATKKTPITADSLTVVRPQNTIE